MTQQEFVSGTVRDTKKLAAEQMKIIQDRGRELLSGGWALDGMSPSRGETEEQIKKIGAGRVDLTMLLSDLILASVYCDGDLAAKSYMIKRLKETNPSDTELFGILLGLLERADMRLWRATFANTWRASPLSPGPSNAGTRRPQRCQSKIGITSRLPLRSWATPFVTSQAHRTSTQRTRCQLALRPPSSASCKTQPPETCPHRRDRST